MKKENYKDSIRMLKYFKNARLEIILLGVLMLVSCAIGILIPIFTANLITGITDFDT